MKCTALVVTSLVAVASVTSATDYQPALRALAASGQATPSANTISASTTERQSHPVEFAAAEAAGNAPTAVIDAEGKKSKEWWGGLGRERPWGGLGRRGGYGGWEGYGGGWGW